MIKENRDPTQQELLDLFNYDPTTGILYWKLRPGNARFNKRYGNKPAGSIDDKRLRVKVNKKHYYVSRMIWILINGSIPDGKIIDHKNRNTLDNRICNLRLSTHSENAINRPSQGILGLKGVTRFKGRFMARVYKDGVCHYLGLHDSAQEAGMAYDAKAMEVHQQFAQLNFA